MFEMHNIFICSWNINVKKYVIYEKWYPYLDTDFGSGVGLDPHLLYLAFYAET